MRGTNTRCKSGILEPAPAPTLLPRMGARERGSQGLEQYWPNSADLTHEQQTKARRTAVRGVVARTEGTPLIQKGQN